MSTAVVGIDLAVVLMLFLWLSDHHSGYPTIRKYCSFVCLFMPHSLHSGLLKKCWHKNPESRPKFENIITDLEHILEEEQKKVDIGYCQSCIIC